MNVEYEFHYFTMKRFWRGCTNPTIFCMKVWATNPITAANKFWTRLVRFGKDSIFEGQTIVENVDGGILCAFNSNDQCIWVISDFECASKEQYETVLKNGGIEIKY